MVFAQSLYRVALVASLLLFSGAPAQDRTKSYDDNPICEGSVDPSICNDPYCHCSWTKQLDANGDSCLLIRAYCY